MIITLSLKVRLKFGCDVTKSSFSEVACGGNGGSVRDKDFLIIRGEVHMGHLLVERKELLNFGFSTYF